MNKIIVANWKMNPMSIEEAAELARGTDMKKVVIVPPFPFLSRVKDVLKHAKLGAQDVFWTDSGAYTGEVSPMMLVKLGVKFVIVGHSERRNYFHETDETVNKKIHAALTAKLSVIFCVGENKDVRKKGIRHAEEFIRHELQRGLESVAVPRHAKSIIVAYEPIWAIGTGDTATPNDIETMAMFIKEWFRKTFGAQNVPDVLYGGSVSGGSAHAIAKCGGIDGVLVGGASLRAEEFKTIVQNFKV
ncbi:MAG: triose-phosphate isomerase [Candidatus Jorgensenbacteria bacterium]|nr:triose-phosphate isomerase [Candidatus Jorgensenbacteria bacterium]